MREKNALHVLVLTLHLLVLVAGCRDRDERPPEREPEPGVAVPVVDAFAPAKEAAWPERILVDGNVVEWPMDAALVADPIGDGERPFDVSWLRAARQGAHLLIAFDAHDAANLYSGGGAGLVLVVEGERALRIDFQRRRITANGRRVHWDEVGALVAPSHAGKTFEIALRYEGPASVRLEGADRVGPLAVDAGPEAPAPRSPERAPGTALRIASLNTHRAGLVDPLRGGAIRRLLRAAEADVICLQELGGADAEEIAAALSGWQVHRGLTTGVTGNAIASRTPLRGLETGSPRLVSALIEGASLVVVSVHLPCCGHLGSEEDAARLAEARLLAAHLRAIRGGMAGVPPDAAVVVAGDFNDVGSPELRRAMEAAGLTLAPVTHLVRPATFTWTKAKSRFPPSTLDLVFHGRRLRRLGGFVLDTSELDDALLARLALERGDSLASDHRLVVVDLAR